MKLRQRLAIWAGTLALVMSAAAFAWRDRPPVVEWIMSGPPSARLPDRILPVAVPNQLRDPRLLIVVENTPQARPQSGLADACLVFEMPVETGITRFLLSYCDRSPRVIGPVRSVRKFMLDIASDLGAVVVHAGYSAEALALITAKRLPVLNEFWTSKPFWRDRAREMPHNLYTGLGRLQAALEKKPLSVKPRPLPFALDPTEEPDAGNGTPGAPALTVSLDFGPLYAVRYQYDPARQRYARYLDGRPHLDADGRQIAPTSIVVLFVRWSEVIINRQLSSKIDLVGSGRLLVIRGGWLYEGKWTRREGGPLALRDAAGHPVVLPAETVWVELFPTDRPYAVLPGSAPVVAQ